LISGSRTNLTLSATPPPRRPHREEIKVNDQTSRSARLRYTATGALAALAVVGAIAGTAALAAKPAAKASHHAALMASCGTAKTPSAASNKRDAPQPSPNPQPFLNDIQQLVDSGTITPTEAQVVDREIVSGRIDTDSLTASGFTQTQLQAVQQALGNTKRGLASAAHGSSK
jgi:hypothetical protein